MAGSTELQTSSGRPVPAVDKAARVMRALAQSGGPRGISDLARELDVSKGTLRDVLLTLQSHGLVDRDPDQRFRLGKGLRALADATTPDVTTVAQPFLSALFEAFGETVILGLRVGDKLEIASRLEPASGMHVSATVGVRLPVAAGAHGKVLIGNAAVGYDDEEYRAGVRAVAAPIVDARGKKIGAFLVVGFKDRLDLRAMRRIGERCGAAARGLSARLGAKQANL